MNRFSIIQSEKKCYVCGTLNSIHTHEVFYGKNRNNSINDGCCAYLCVKHHNGSNEGVHFNHKLDLELKQKTQLAWMKYYNKTQKDFIDKYKRNYLEEK